MIVQRISSNSATLVAVAISKPFKRNTAPLFLVHKSDESSLVSNFGVDINRTDEFDASPLMLVSFQEEGSNSRRVYVDMPKLCSIYLIRGLF
jgi:hypothetical protein